MTAPFAHTSSPALALLFLHGLGGTPREVQPALSLLEDLPIHIETPSLPGHNTSLQDFKSTLYPDWLAYAEQRFLSLRKQYEHVIIGGFSMGGTIGMELASRYPLAGLIALAAPHFIYRLYPLQVKYWSLPWLRWLQYIIPQRNIPPPSPAVQAIAPSYGYLGTICLAQVYSLIQGCKAVQKRLHHISCPLLIMHDIHDRVVLPDNALELARKVASQHITLHYTAITEDITNHHMITTHQETHLEVAQAIRSFIQTRLQALGA